MDDLISRKAAIDQAMGKLDHTDLIFDTATESEIVYMLRSLPSVPAVPLDKLCEWLSSHAYKKTGYYITDPGEARYAHEWEHDIREWMEGLDAADKR